MKQVRHYRMVGICLLLAACGNPSQSDSVPDHAQRSGASTQATLQQGLATTADNIAANMSGEVRRIEGPLFDDFHIELDHAITMDNRMQMGPSRTRILDLELFETAPKEAVATLRQRLLDAGFSLNSADENRARQKWDFRRYDNDRNLQGVIVTVTEQPLRTDRRPQHDAATALLYLTVSDSRQR